MSEGPLIDHLFRHQYAKMVAVLTRIFGLAHLEMVEDAVQDTFARAVQSWKIQAPENPEAWLMRAARNRVIDLIRKIQSSSQTELKLESGPQTLAIDELFLDHEIADSQLRMIFAACHPALQPQDQIAFALRTISGFSQKEIAAALLLKEDSIKKRLQRARKLIREQEIAFNIPTGQSLAERRALALHVIYLIFNEGFHSTQRSTLVRHDLCGEAMRLCRMITENQFTQNGSAYALLALMCFHAARLPSKLDGEGNLIDLRNQDRSKWYGPLVIMGDECMTKAVEYDGRSSYYYEAAIASEHHRAKTFELTNWTRILEWQQALIELEPSALRSLNLVSIHLELQHLDHAEAMLKEVDAQQLEQRQYLLEASWAELFIRKGKMKKAASALDRAISLASNSSEMDYLKKKKDQINLPPPRP